MELAPGIELYENVMINSEEIISDLEVTLKKYKLPWVQTQVYTDSGFTTTNLNVRSCSKVPVPYYIDPIKYLPKEILELSTTLSKEFHKSILDYTLKYQTNIKHYYGYDILKYTESQKFESHSDDGIDEERRISLVYYMNDNYEGGEIEFKKFDLKIKPKKHNLLLFPSSYIYRHKVYPVTSGTRYAIVQWMR